MDSKVVNRRIKGIIWTQLRETGFETHSSRTAWRHFSDRVEVVNFQSYSAYNAAVMGCTTFSFSVNLGCYILAIPPSFEPSRLKEKKGRLLPNEFECHFRGRISPSKFNIWFIDEAGENRDFAIQDVSSVLKKCGLPWFEQFVSPAEVLRMLRDEPQTDSFWGFGNEGSPARHYCLGYVARNLNDKATAKEHLQRALDSGCFSSVKERLTNDISHVA